MVLVLLFVILISILFFLSRFLTKSLSRLLFLKTRSEKITITYIALLFLPGVVLHELAHLFVAQILFVKTGKVEFFPQMQGNSVKLGSVAIAKTDIFRRFLIGSAPIWVGIIFLSVSFWYIRPFSDAFTWRFGLFLFLLFEVGNTMFSSRKDMEEGGFFLGILLILTIIIIPFFRSSLQQLIVLPASYNFLLQMDMMFILVITIDSFLYFFTKILLLKN